MFEKRIMKKGVAAVLAFALSFSFVCQPIGAGHADAASGKRALYIKEIRVFTENGGEAEDAKKWCNSQPENQDHDKTNDWDYFEGNLNKGASAALKREVGVFLVYQTTEDPNEAITDLAVMNEQGNYSGAEYKDILKKQEETYRDIVSDMCDMLKEYRKNVNEKVDIALQAQKFMNGYIEDDSGKPLGDFLLGASDEELIPVLMQANGQVVLMIQERLAYACDTAKTTWLERMAKLGSYKTLRDKALAAYKNDANKADKALDKKYKDKAVELAGSWDDIRTHIKHCQEYTKAQGIDKMTEAEYDAWAKKTQDDEDANLYRDEAPIVALLSKYSYEDGTLVDYFMNDYAKDIDGNLRQLYPLVACLTEGQQAAVNESVSLFTMVMNASAASVFNDGNQGVAGQTGEKMSSEDKNNAEKVEKELDASLDKWEKNAISVYDGVDREVYKDGVAVTSTAKNYSNGVEKNWAEVFVDSGNFRNAAIGTAIGAGVFAAGAIAMCYAQTASANGMMAEVYSTLKTNVKWEMEFDDKMNLIIPDYDEAYYAFDCTHSGFDDVGFYYGDTATDAVKKQSQLGKDELMKKALTKKGNATKLKVMQGLKIGFTVAAVLLSVADIVMTSVTLYKYYNREHLPIPHHMVDMSYNENQETSYVAYRSVLDTEGNYSDLNGGGGMQWLALYATKDSDAGKPILAPTENGKEFICQMGKEESPGAEYSPLHLFGTEATPQNLTFADGENGWSYNDKEGGVYLFFQRDALSRDDAAEGTALSGGLIVLIGMGGMFVGFILAIVFMSALRRKKVVSDNADKM
ncbi:MAG: hypothetical protein K5639_03780 [Eubacterium sp.]|nr:hypothetical protein [Eubacterium sp.]